MTGHVEALHRELSERNVDLVIARRFGPIADERLDFEFLFDDSFVVAAGVHHPCVRRRKIELAELVSEAWVLPPPGSVIASVVMEAFGARGLDYPRTTVVTESLRGADEFSRDQSLCHDFPGFRIEIFRQELGGQSIVR